MKFNDVITLFSAQNCTIDITEQQFKLMSVKDIIPFYCENNHLVKKLSLNTFKARVKNNNSLCRECYDINVHKNRFNKINDILLTKNCKLLSLNKDRSLTYLCHCGNTAKTRDSNIIKNKWHSCSNCIINPFTKPEIQEKIRQTNIATFGKPNQFQNPENIQKSQQTCLIKYGVRNVMQNKEIYELNTETAHKFKLYTFPSGRQEYIQGYENRCIDDLLSIYNENDIVIGSTKMPEIWYKMPNRKFRSKYVPDIYIPKDNLIIEVKSDYTIQKEHAKNIAKFHATRKLYTLHVYVYGKISLLYTKIYTKDLITVIPYPMTEVVFVE